MAGLTPMAGRDRWARQNHRPDGSAIRPYHDRQFNVLNAQLSARSN
jgi:hypothetical protein